MQIAQKLLHEVWQVHMSQQDAHHDGFEASHSQIRKPSVKMCKNLRAWKYVHLKHRTAKLFAVENDVHDPLVRHPVCTIVLAKFNSSHYGDKESSSKRKWSGTGGQTS